MIEAGDGLKPWSRLTDDERGALQAAYQAELDKEPPTCSLETKVERFARWLATQGVAFSMDDVNAKR
ncbi:MAG: hypothetical protein K0M55_17455 [Rhizobium sp.]|nr:hypothetical protein [Rhizobium sp.]MBW8444929.1 hypothetical protein [Arenimonas sp.]